MRAEHIGVLLTTNEDDRGSITALTASCKPGWSLPGRFYADPAIYRADLEQVWRKGWLFAGHTCEIPRPGDFFTLSVDTDSVIVIRDEDGAIHGLHNVCRHHGSLICTEAAGRAKRLVCPYHQWSYGLGGELISCRGMHEDLDKAQFSLKQLSLQEVEGLIYISLAKEPLPFEPARELISPLARPQGFTQARVAKAVDYLGVEGSDQTIDSLAVSAGAEDDADRERILVNRSTPSCFLPDIAANCLACLL